MFALPLVFVLGIANAQSSEWKTGSITYSTGGDSIVTTDALNSIGVDMRTAMTLREDPNVGIEDNYRSTIAYKLPSKLSFQWKVTETLTNSDSINAIKGIQFSSDNVTWTASIALDTLISATTDTNATVSEWHILSLSEFPDMRYFRINHTDASASGDTSSAVDEYGLRFTQ